MKGNIKYSQIVTQALYNAREELQKISKEGYEISHTGAGFGDLQNDTEIKADRVLGEFIEHFLLQYPGISHIQVEGREIKENPGFNGSETLTAYVDPLDGSLSYRQGAMVTQLKLHPFPYSGVITLVKGEKSRFEDIVACGVIDFRSGDLFVAEVDKPTKLNGEIVKLTGPEKLSLADQIIIGEFYYDSNRKRLTEIFDGQNGYLRSIGSSALEMAYVSCGLVSAYICETQKQHELIAAYLLVKGAGGWVSDLNGETLDNFSVKFNSKTPVILATNEGIGKEIINRIPR